MQVRPQHTTRKVFCGFSEQPARRVLGGIVFAAVLIGAFSVSSAAGSEPLAEVTETDWAEAGFTRYDALVASITIFVLAVFLGFEVITKVPPTLHTPLMSGANAISGITIVGALLATGTGVAGLAPVLGTLALIMATVNVVGGFLVTHRMLSMFQRK